jgi:predicted acyl esterase
MEDSILYFVERGYAHILVDFRGLGNSGGINKEPIDPQEDQDGYDICNY